MDKDDGEKGQNERKMGERKEELEGGRHQSLNDGRMAVLALSSFCLFGGR